MQLNIENFRGIKHASVELSDKITVFAGPVGSGKTSAVQALQALVTGETVPLTGLKKKDAVLLVNDKTMAGKGQAQLKHNGQTSEIKWPSCKSSGMTFKCSKYAAGMLKPSRIEAKDLGEILNILPTREDFDEEIKDVVESLDLPADAIWEKVTKSGWKVAHDQAVEKGRDMKRDWERIAGQNHSADRVANFTPENYTGEPLEKLESALEGAKKLHAHAVKAETLGEKEKEDLKTLAGQAGEIENKIADLTIEIGSVESKLAKAQKTLEAIPKALNQQQAYQCWHCEKFGVINGTKLVEAPNMETAKADNEAAQAQLLVQRGTINDLQHQKDELSVSLRVQNDALAKSKDAQKKLNASVIDTESFVSAEDAQADVVLWQLRIQAHHAKIESDELYEALSTNAYVQAVLCPDGLRKQVLSKKLTEFNELLDTVCEIGGWKPIALDEFMDITYGGRPYILLSKGEQLAVNAGLQIALTRMDGSQIVIIDDIQAFDTDMVDGLFEILSNIPLPSVIGCTAATHAQALIPPGGMVYWCNGGVMGELKELVTA